LSRSNIESIPKEIFKMERLEELYLDENRIKEIPTEI
jgi:Leucine-rich repeat (LRR) protein